jgi:hypothetical protein
MAPARGRTVPNGDNWLRRRAFGRTSGCLARTLRARRNTTRLSVHYVLSRSPRTSTTTAARSAR